MGSHLENSVDSKPPTKARFVTWLPTGLLGVALIILIFVSIPILNPRPEDELVDCRDLTSACLVKNAWLYLKTDQLEQALSYANRTIKMFSADADRQQQELGNVIPAASNADQYWALNDVGAAWFILGEAYRQQGRQDDAKASYCAIIQRYPSAQIFDPERDAFNVAQQMAGAKLREMGIQQCGEN